MKKIITMLILISILGLSACGGEKEETVSNEVMDSNETQADEKEDLEDTTVSDQSVEALGDFDTSASIIETVLVDENDVKITATGLNYNNSSVNLELIIENNSAKNLTFISGSAGYGCNSINGYMINDGYLNCDIIAGKKAKETISFSCGYLMLHGIDEVADIEIGFDISDDDYNHSYTGPRQVKTSMADSYNYDENRYQTRITSDAAKNEFEYSISYFSTDKLYEQNEVSVISEGIMTTHDGETSLLLEILNNSSDQIYTVIGDISINGLIVHDSRWTGDMINPGKRGIVDIDFLSVFDESYWEIFSIKEVETIGFSLSQETIDGEVIVEPCEMAVTIPNTAGSFDKTGTEVYNKDGLKIIYKTIVEDSSEYIYNTHVLLLVENNSGAMTSVDDVYESLSVNGFMSDYYFYGVELKDGECAVLELELVNDEPDEAVDINEIEIGVRIEKDGTVIDEPTLKLVETTH